MSPPSEASEHSNHAGAAASSANRCASTSIDSDFSAASSLTPRQFLRSSRSSRSSSTAAPALLQVTAGINGRLGLATSTTLTVTETTLAYGRYEIPLVEIEQVAYDEMTSDIAIKFSFRPKPKHFILDSPASCRKVCQTLGELLDAIDNGTTPARVSADAADDFDDVKPPPPVTTPSDVRGSHGNLFHFNHGGLSTPGTPPHGPPPEWLLRCFERMHCGREAGEIFYSRARSGWCCKRFLLEATLFGVLMPIATACYWLRDAAGLGARTGRKDASGHQRWLLAECGLNKLLIVPRQIYHHGKFADAKDVAYQEGRIWRLEPVYNASVTLKRTLYWDGHPTYSNWPKAWAAYLHTTPAEQTRPHCDGQVLHTVHEVRRDCAALAEWIPQKWLGLNRTSAQDCYVDRNDKSKVYLDIDEPLGFYLDWLLIFIMLTIALTFAVCIVTQHWNAISRGLNTMRNSMGSGGTVTAEGSNRASSSRDVERRLSRENSGGRVSGEHSRRPSAGGGGGGSLRMLTPDNLKSAYRQVVQGFHEMV